ncbi:peptide-methionine (S)-S-oxide reductase MsrA [Limnobacter sp.]|uniref:peptide-methionine (S)-S-oxide reductase MsrA n=1 Tax=Limnobacter sp. TaxID=2003368 RepID=UPI00351452B2
MARVALPSKLAALLLINCLPWSAHAAAQAEAIFGGGCFWCMEEAFEKLPGVSEVVSGYTGGKTPNPSYDQVSSGTTGHVEVVRVLYNPEQVSYAKLLEHFWINIDPTVKNRQFCDVGEQYRSVIYTLNAAQQQAAAKSKEDLINSGRFAKVYTTVESAQTFYVAEDYHQDFYKKNPLRYKYYKTTCGRQNRLNELWGKATTP